MCPNPNATLQASHGSICWYISTNCNEFFKEPNSYFLSFSLACTFFRSISRNTAAYAFCVFTYQFLCVKSKFVNFGLDQTYSVAFYEFQTPRFSFSLLPKVGSLHLISCPSMCGSSGSITHLRPCAILTQPLPILFYICANVKLLVIV